MDILGAVKKEMRRLMAPPAPDTESRVYLTVPISSGITSTLDVDVPNLPGQVGMSLSPETQDYLKSILCALAEKFQSQKSAEDEVEQLRRTNEALIQGRIDLEESLNDTTKQLREEGAKADKFLARVQEERTQMAQVLEKQTSINRDLEAEVERLKKHIATLQRDLTSQKASDLESR